LEDESHHLFSRFRLTLGQARPLHGGAMKTCPGANKLWNLLAEAIAKARISTTLNGAPNTDTTCLGEREIKSFVKIFYTK